MREQITETKMHALDYWQVVRNRWGVIILTFLLVCLAALIIVHLMEKKFLGRVKLEILNTSMAKPSVFNQGGPGTSAQWLETQFKIITSRETLKNVVEKKDLAKKWNTDENTACDKLLSMVEPQDERGTELMMIDVYSPKPEEAAELAEAVAESYIARRKEQEKGSSETKSKILDNEIASQKNDVDEKRIKMLELAKLHKIIDVEPIHPSIEGGSNTNTGKAQEVERLQAQLTEATTAVANNRTTLEKLKSLEGDFLIEVAVGLLGNEITETIRQFYPEYQKALVSLKSLTTQGLGAKHPKVIVANQQIAQMRKMLNDSVGSLKQSLTTKLQIADESLKNLQAQLEEAKKGHLGDATMNSEYVMAKREYEQEFALLNEMRGHAMKQKVEDVMPSSPVIYHERAVAAADPAKPNFPLLMGVGAFVGLVMGLVFAFFLEYLDTSVKTLDDVERYLGVPVLAVIPKDVGILHKQSGLSPDAEAYRILRTNIEFNRKSADANAITIVSGGAGEGKSTTLVNLAYICAQGGYNTLMIDGDLRRPKLHTFFDINNSVGLTNYLTTALMLEDVILQTPIDNLYFMPSGILPADAAGILNSRRMSELIADLKNRFDLVLIDSPPILGVSDASVLASEVDLTIIVIQHRKLPRNMLLRVKQAIENVGGNLLGVVLNNVDVRSDSQYQYYTSYYTYYSPTNTESKPKSRPTNTGSSGKQQAQAPAKTAAPDEEDDY